jgi:hypothetical protein
MAHTEQMPRPKRSDKDNEKVSSAEKGTKPGEARKTYILPVDLIDKTAEIAYIDRKYEKEVIAEALQKYIAAYEKKNGEIKIKKKNN